MASELRMVVIKKMLVCTILVVFAAPVLYQPCPGSIGLVALVAPEYVHRRALGRPSCHLTSARSGCRGPPSPRDASPGLRTGVVDVEI
jgi:hypothetical protein